MKYFAGGLTSSFEIVLRLPTKKSLNDSEGVCLAKDMASNCWLSREADVNLSTLAKGESITLVQLQDFRSL